MSPRHFPIPELLVGYRVVSSPFLPFDETEPCSDTESGDECSGGHGRRKTGKQIHWVMLKKERTCILSKEAYAALAAHLEERNGN